jgi:hypothetical protein
VIGLRIQGTSPMATGKSTAKSKTPAKKENAGGRYKFKFDVN